MQVDSFTPAHSASGLPIYVAPLPAGSIQRVCHYTLPWLISFSLGVISCHCLKSSPLVIPMKSINFSKILALIGLAMTAINPAAASVDEDKKIVAALDTRYQAAVEKNDAETMARIHHENMVLVLSDGTVQTGAFLEQRARDRVYTWEHQVEVDNSQVVRVWGDTAVVTAKLWLKGTKAKGGAINFKLWFSDTYIRTPTGWRYVFGQ